MARRKEETPPAGSPAWMATFSDLMNLLLCFFVLLFSMSTIEEERWNELVASLNSSFSIFDAGATAIGEGILISNGVSQLNELDKYINSIGRADNEESDGDKLDKYEEEKPSTSQEESGQAGKTEDAELTDEEAMEKFLAKLEAENLQQNEELSELIEEALKEGRVGDEIQVSFNSQYVQLSMKGALLFESASAELKDEAKAVLDKAAVILEWYAKGIVEIEGHTDNVPMNSARYANNEELSSARALSVFYYLCDNSYLDKANLRHAGMGDRMPIADNSTPEGRSKNRRVEIRIYNSAY